MKIPSRVVLFSSLFCAFSAHAIVNIENMRSKLADADGWSGTAKLNVAGSSGNTDKLSAGFGGLVQHRLAGVTDMVSFSYDYAENNGASNTDKQMLHLRRTAAWKTDIDWEAFTQWQRNEFTNLSQRVLLGGGLRWDLASTGQRSNGVRLFLGTGLFAESESIKNGADQDTVRANVYLSAAQPLFRDSTLRSTVYLQPSLEDAGDLRAIGEFVFSVPMDERLALEVSVDFAHDSEPPTGIKQTDWTYQTGLSWSF